jgi:hypothetical protein
MTTAADRLPIPTTPPDGWEFETPRYRVVRDTQPAEKPRFRSEPPFSRPVRAASGSTASGLSRPARLSKRPNGLKRIFFR